MDQRFVIAIFSGFLHPIANQGGLDADGRCPLLWFWHRGSATLQAVIAGWKADHDQHNDVLNLVKQFDLLGWLCCQECLRWSAGGCGITYVVEATWSQSQGDGHLHRLRMANGWTDGSLYLIDERKQVSILHLHQVVEVCTFLMALDEGFGDRK